MGQAKVRGNLERRRALALEREAVAGIRTAGALVADVKVPEEESKAASELGLALDENGAVSRKDPAIAAFLAMALASGYMNPLPEFQGGGFYGNKSGRRSGRGK